MAADREKYKTYGYQREVLLARLEEWRMALTWRRLERYCTRCDLLKGLECFAPSRKFSKPVCRRCLGLAEVGHQTDWYAEVSAEREARENLEEKTGLIGGQNNVYLRADRGGQGG